MKILTILVVFSSLLMSSCATISEQHKKSIEDCVVRMVREDVPPMKAHQICETIHRLQQKDLQ